MFYNIFFTYFHKNNPRNIWPVTGKALPLHSLSGSKRASAKRAGPAEANESANAKARRPRPEEKSKKSCRKIWSVKKNRLPLQSFSASRKASAAEAPPSGTGIPEDIEKAYNRQRQESTRANKIEPARKSRSQFLNRPRGHAAEKARPARQPAGHKQQARWDHVLKQKKKKKQDNNNEEFDPGSG